MLELSAEVQSIAGVVLLTVVAVQFGGVFLLKVVQGDVPTTEFQRAYFRAGHAHAGMFITLGLVCLLLSEAAGLEGFFGYLARTGVLSAAILMPAGFFFSAMGKGRERPNRWSVLLVIGGIVLAAGVVSLGLGLLLG